jgi:hypothetical protein
MVLSMYILLYEYDIRDPPLPVINIHSKSLRHSAAVKGLSIKIVKTALLELKGYTSERILKRPQLK